jgi:ribose 5-phosphate isomerase A
MFSADEIKQNLGRQAAQLVQPGMTVGIGTGSTADWFIHYLAERIQNGLSCRGVPTSQHTKLLAQARGISIVELNEADHIDLTIDGADEITPQLQLIKGGGGALLQEKMVAAASQKRIIIADETKMVMQLGKFPLPVEVIPYGWKHTKRQIERVGCKNVVLRAPEGEIFVTDHGHYILDCHFQKIDNAVLLHTQLNNIPGVADNGLCIDLADQALIGYADGTIKTFSVPGLQRL